jgi:dethiobiotin synthetase
LRIADCGLPNGESEIRIPKSEIPIGAVNMATLYVTSSETFSGKSALCIGLGKRFQRDGLKVGYMKPVNTLAQSRAGGPYDADVEFAKQTFDLPEPVDILSPVAITPPEGRGQDRL